MVEENAAEHARRALTVLRVVAIATRAKEVEILFAEASHLGLRDLQLHDLGVAILAVVRKASRVVVADGTSISRPLASSVARHRSERLLAPANRLLLEHKFVLNMPEAPCPKINLDAGFGRGSTQRSCGCHSGAEAQGLPPAQVGRRANFCRMRVRRERTQRRSRRRCQEKEGAHLQ